MRLLHDWIDSYVTWTENSEPPKSFRMWAAIATVSSVLERKVWLNWEGKLFANQYIVLVAKAGRARKGTAMRPAENLLREIGVNLAAEAMTLEALIKRMSLLAGIPNIDMGNLVTSQDSALTIFSEEWTVFIGYDNGRLMSFLCNFYDCKDEWTYETKNAGTFVVSNIWLNMFAGTTPELLWSTLPPDFVGGGLTSRTIFVCEEDKGKVVMLPIETDEGKQLRDKLLSDLRKIKALTGAFKYTTPFMNVYMPWRIEHEKNIPFKDTQLEAYSQRRVTHFLKLAMVLNASRTDSMELSAEDAQRAIRILTQTERKMPMAFRGMGRAHNAETMNRLMTTIFSRKRITVRELMQLFWQDVASPEELNVMLKALKTMDVIDVENTATDTYIISKDKAE